MGIDGGTRRRADALCNCDRCADCGDRQQELLLLGRRHVQVRGQYPALLRRTMTRTTITVVAVLGLAAIPLAVSAANGAGGGERGKRVRIHHAAAPKAVAPELRANFAVFRRSRTAGDELDMGRSTGV